MIGIVAYDGGTISLGPGAKTYALGGAYATTAEWYADNLLDTPAGGLLDFSSLETIEASAPWNLYVRALVGGQVNLKNIKSLPANGYFDAYVTDPGSLLDLGSFQGIGGANTTAKITVDYYGVLQLNRNGPTDLTGIDLIVGWEAQVRGGTLLLGQGSRLSGDGTVQTGVVSAAGTVSPGYAFDFPGYWPGILTIKGDYTQGPGGTLLIEIAGRDPGSGYDVLAITGNAQLGGTLQIVKSDTFDLQPGMALKILDLSDATKTLSGRFAGLAEGGLAWSGTDDSLYITYRGGDGNDLVLYTVPEPGALVLLISGGLCLALFLRRRSRS